VAETERQKQEKASLECLKNGRHVWGLQRPPPN